MMTRQNRRLPVLKDADLDARSQRDLEDEVEVLEQSREEDVAGIRSRLAAKRARRRVRGKQLAVLADALAGGLDDFGYGEKGRSLTELAKDEAEVDR